MPTIKKIKPETAVQCALLEWFRLQYPNYFKYVVKISNENAFRGKAFEMGLHTGASDLFFAIPNRYHFGLWLEVKPPKFKVTKSNELHYANQRAFIEKMKSVGYDGSIEIGFDNCRYFVYHYMKDCI